MPPTLPIKNVLDKRWNLLLYPFLATSAVVFTNDNIAEINWIDRNSMSPTLSPTYHETGQSDYALFNKLRPLGTLQRGDVVSFWSPHKPECLVVKRVIGLEGDTVLLDSKRRPGVQGTPGEDMERRHWKMMGQWDWAAQDDRGAMGHAKQKRPAVTVPFGHLWVEGDNWRETEDSNTYGPVRFFLPFPFRMELSCMWY